jgi:hypothetical protein
MIAAEPSATARVPPPPTPEGPGPGAPEQVAELAVRRLCAVVLYGKPRRAIAAFRCLTVLGQFFRETHARVIELSRTGRPSVAAAAVAALVQARLAHRRFRDGRGPLLGP